MLTYSINVGTITETNNLSGITEVLSEIPDNTSQLVTPKDIRDAIYTSWTHNVFKPTTITSSSVEYIGIDSSQAGINLKEKIFIGKRNLSGSDIMSDLLLNSDTDIFIYNTKQDIDNQYTKISLLSGSDNSLYVNSPYIQSEYVIGTSSNYLDLNITNPSGFVNISASQSVSVNGLIFPSVNDVANSTDGYTLKYYNVSGQYYLKLQPSGTSNIDTIYSTGTVSITGSPVIINGSNIQLTNSKKVPYTIGGILSGTTFSNANITDVLNKLFYPYVPLSEVISLSASSISSIVNNNTSNIVVETNSVSSLVYYYNITNGTYPLQSVLTSPGGTLPPTPSRLTGTSSISVPGSSQVYTIQITDGTQSVTATSSISFVNPYFYGVTNNIIDFSTIGYFNQLNKYVKSKSDTTVSLVGDNVYIYFLYPSSYGDITSIIDTSDGLNFNFITSFSKIYSGISLTSSTPSWSNTYNIYKYVSGTGKTTVNSNWTFKH